MIFTNFPVAPFFIFILFSVSRAPFWTTPHSSLRRLRSYRTGSAEKNARNLQKKKKNAVRERSILPTWYAPRLNGFVLYASSGSSPQDRACAWRFPAWYSPHDGTWSRRSPRRCFFSYFFSLLVLVNLCGDRYHTREQTENKIL